MSSAERVVAVLQARMGSTRLPGKILRPLAGAPMLERIVERGRAIAGVDEVVIATTDTSADEPVRRLAAEHSWKLFSGSEADVLDRYYRAATNAGASHVMRLTADCPLMDFREAGRVVSHHLKSGADYTHNITVWGGQMPLGTGVEIFTMAALEASWRDGHEPHHREHVDEFVYEHPERFRLERVTAPPELQRPELRLTVDTPEDYALTASIYDRLYHGAPIELGAVIALLDAEPALLALNRHVEQKLR